MEFKNELLLSASRFSWKMSSSHGTKSDPKYKKYGAVWKEVWSRDGYKCHFCNCSVKDAPEIHHINSNHSDNSKDNLAAICVLCHQSFHLDIVSNTNGGRVIWLPEFSQQELNYLCRALFVAQEQYEQAEMNKQEVSSFARVAKTLLTSLDERALVLEQYFKGGNCSDPGVFANVLLNLPKDKYEKREETMYPFKLLHSKTRYNKYIKNWEAELTEMPLDSWMNLLKTGS